MEITQKKIKTEQLLQKYNELFLKYDAGPVNMDVAFLLHNCIAHEDYNELQRLLDDGVDPNQDDIYDESQDKNMSFLWTTCRIGAHVAVEMLLKAGADPNPTDGSMPPLFIAIHYEYEHIVYKLLLYGADQNQKYEGDSSLMYAIKCQSGLITNLLLNPPYPMSKILLICCAREYLSASPFHDNNLCRDMFCEILKHARILPDLNQADSHGFSCLSHLIMLGVYDVAKTLLKNGAVVDKSVYDCMFKSISYKNVEAVRFMLENGADPNYSDEHMNLLEYAMIGANGGVEKLLLEYGASTNMTKEDVNKKFPMELMVWTLQ